MDVAKAIDTTGTGVLIADIIIGALSSYPISSLST
ncbi:hypothetical protein J2S09_002633 [Bacillus fengqiuensis]|nr:hypothetical protein [Bacillus fengqiuensis]